MHSRVTHRSALLVCSAGDKPRVVIATASHSDMGPAERLMDFVLAVPGLQGAELADRFPGLEAAPNLQRAVQLHAADAKARAALAQLDSLST